MRIAVTIVTILMLQACQKQVKVTTSSCLQSVPDKVLLVTSTFQMGTLGIYPEEGPERAVQVYAFNIDATEVTNREFAAFVKAAVYVTTAEKPQTGFGKAGAAVFMNPTVANPGWWHFVEGANWRHPEGPGSDIEGHDQDPVVQVSYADATAYAKWAGRRLPSEAEWEYAAKAGSGEVYVWGKNLTPAGQHQANTWQGAFPLRNTQADGYRLRAPVGCFPANTFGLYDMIGNVWEWTDTIYQSGEGEPVYTIKGGSFLCAPNYCRRYRASARQPQEAGLPTNHIGFRTVSQD